MFADVETVAQEAERLIMHAIQTRSAWLIAVVCTETSTLQPDV